jgi:hypothetical protein
LVADGELAVNLVSDREGPEKEGAGVPYDGKMSASTAEREIAVVIDNCLVPKD